MIMIMSKQQYQFETRYYKLDHKFIAIQMTLDWCFHHTGKYLLDCISGHYIRISPWRWAEMLLLRCNITVHWWWRMTNVSFVDIFLTKPRDQITLRSESPIQPTKSGAIAMFHLLELKVKLGQHKGMANGKYNRNWLLTHAFQSNIIRGHCRKLLLPKPSHHVFILLETWPFGTCSL